MKKPKKTTLTKTTEEELIDWFFDPSKKSPYTVKLHETKPDYVDSVVYSGYTRMSKKTEVKEYKALYISDIHWSNKLPGAIPTTNGMTDRLEDQIKLFEHIKKTLSEQPDICVIYILGDLFDKALVDPVTMTAAAKAMASLPIDAICILPGNHDSNSTKGGRFITEVFGAIDFAYAKDKFVCLESGRTIRPQPWLELCCLPYSSKEQATKELKDFQRKLVADGTQRILLMHHSINGCQHGGWVCDDGLDADEVVQGFDFVLSGHFHDHQMFGPDLQGMYLGAPMHHRFDDVGRDAQYWVITFREDGDHQFEKIDPGLPKFWILKSLDEELPEGCAPGDFVRYKIKATKENWEKIKFSLFEKIANLQNNGYRADFVHKPIPITVDRMSGDEVSASPEDALKPRSLIEQIASYVDYVSPETIDLKLLKKIGKEIFEESKLA